MDESSSKEVEHRTSLGGVWTGLPFIRNKKKQAFLAAFIDCGSLSAAARAAGVDRVTHYKWLQRDPSYVRQFEAAEDEVADKYEDEVSSRALAGKTDQQSAVLLMFRLKGLRPEKYRDNYGPQLTINAPAAVTINVQATPAPPPLPDPDREEIDVTPDP